MSDPAMLVVVMVSDAGLRSLFAARLTLLGVDLLTVSHPAQLCPRKLREPAVLIIDEADMADAPAELIGNLWREGRWGRIAVLTTSLPALAADRDWLIHVDKDSACETMIEHIEEWAKLDRLSVCR